MDDELKIPDYRPRSYFTKKRVAKAHKKQLRKIARRSRQINYRQAKR